MRYRGLEYTIVQGVERGTWRWTVTLSDGQTKSGTMRGRLETLYHVERTIIRAIASEKAQPISHRGTD
jgi:hypothetical protein